jgi:hypothetical protein
MGVAKLKAKEATVRNMPVEISCSSLLRDPYQADIHTSTSGVNRHGRKDRLLNNGHTEAEKSSRAPAYA